MKTLFTLCILIAGYCSSAQTIFKGGFDDGIIAARHNPSTWTRFAPSKPEPNDHRYKLDSQYVRQGKYSLRVEVRPGDTTNARSDRVEIVGMYDTAVNELYINDQSPVEYFAYSVRFDTGWKQPLKTGIDTSYMEYHGNVIQLKKKGVDVDSTNPAFSMQATNRIFIKTSTGDVNNPDRVIYELSKPSLSKGRWIDFVIKINFNVHERGSIIVWRRDENKTSFEKVLKVNNINTLFYQLAGKQRQSLNHEWHAGYYRSKQLTDGTGITNILWLDGFTIAVNAAAAQQNAFGYVTPLPGDDLQAGVIVSAPAVNKPPVQNKILKLTE